MSNPKAKHKKRGASVTYRTRNTIGLKPFDATSVGSRIYEIRERDGGVQPEIILEEARDDSSVLHPPFEWDDSVAAEHHRLWQARKLIRNVVLVRVDVDEEGVTHEHEVPLVHVPAAGEQPARYDSEDSLVGDTESWTRAYQSALSSVRVAQRRVAELEAMMSAGSHTDQVNVVRVALKGLETAQTALERLH